MSIALYGVAVGKGIAVGRAHVLRHGMDDIPQYTIDEAQFDEEIERFNVAIKATRRELERLRSNIPENAPTELGAFISLHLMLLTDVTISRDPIDIIRENHVNAEWALNIQMHRLSEQFDAIDDTYLRERKQDMLQVVERVFKNLRGQGLDIAGIENDLFDDTILIASDLSPADTVYFKDSRICAFVTDMGGPTSHTAILGRSLEIPSVIALHNAREIVRENDWVIVDGISGSLIVNPDDLILAEYRQLAREYRSHQRQLAKLKNTVAATLNQIPVEILANIEGLADIAQVNKIGADGVGLFRSEFLFLNRADLPDEEEQYELYTKILKKMKGKPVTIRTVDLGSDKNPRWLEHGDPVNPALGLTGIRLCLAEPVMFRTQMRALLRAGRHGTLKIMWPMISSLSELRQCLAHLETAKEQLREKHLEFAENVEIGIMIEIPAAALSVASLLKYVDFISIGTNDLIQYTLAVDRGDEAVSHLYQPTHPAVLKLLSHVIRTAQKMNKPVAVCGEMAGDAALTRLLLGIGLRRFSMHPANILAVKNVIVHTDIDAIESQLMKLLRNEDPDKSDALVARLNELVCSGAAVP